MTEPQKNTGADVPNVFSAKPYGSSWRKYIEAQYNPLPIPRGKKERPPTGFTGNYEKVASFTDYESWDKENATGNIAVRLGIPFTAEALNSARVAAGVAPLPNEYNGETVTHWCAIGLDVDNYAKSTGTKQGGEGLLTLEAELGRIPATAVSTSRRLSWLAGELGAGILAPQVMPGIRIVLIPASAGRLPGSVDNAIEVIQFSHRYCMAWPSTVDDRTYEWVWYDSEKVASEAKKSTPDYSACVAVLPEPYPLWRLPVLPEKWLQPGSPIWGRVAKEFEGQHTQLKLDELTEWAKENLCAPISEEQQQDWIRGERGMCRMIAQVVDAYAKNIADDPDGNGPAHESMLASTMRLAHLAGEGHCGWQIAKRELYNLWMQRIRDTRTDRDMEEAVSEFERAWHGAMGMQEVKASAGRAVGRKLFEEGSGCVRSKTSKSAEQDKFGTCMSDEWWLRRNTITIEGGSTEWIVDPPHAPGTNVSRNVPYIVPKIPAGLSDEFYDTSDTGNARMLADMYADNVLYARRNEKIGNWMAFSAAAGADRARYGSWYLTDSEHNDVSFNMLFARAIAVWEAYLKRMEVAASKEILAALGKLPDDASTTAQNKATKGINGRIDRIRKHIEYCKGMNGHANAEKAFRNTATRLGPVSVSANKFDRNPYLLGCNGKTLVLPSKQGERATVRAMLKTDRITMDTGVEYIPWDELDSERKTALLKHFDMIWPDKTMHEPAQIMLGLIPLGINPEKILLNAYGDKSNTGKSTTGKMITKCLGEYGYFGSTHVFNNKTLAARQFMIERKRMVYVSEPSGSIDAPTIKAYTGNDPFDGEGKGESTTRNLEFMCTFYIMTNKTIDVPDADEATLKRLRVLPFDNVIDDSHGRDKHAVDEYPKKHAVAMLSWLIDGTNKYFANGGNLLEHPALTLAQEDYASRVTPYGVVTQDILELAPDSLHVFVNQKYQEDTNYTGRKGAEPGHPAWRDHAPEFVVKEDTLMQVFNRWVERNYGHGMVPNKPNWQGFKGHLNTLGVKRLRNRSEGGTPYWCGMRLLTDMKMQIK